MERRERVVFLL